MKRLARWLYRMCMRCRSRRCPEAELCKSAMVFAPHPDDEVLGCGGTVLRKLAAGAKVQIVLMTDGANAFPGLIDAQELSRMRAVEIIEAVDILGIPKTSIDFLSFPDGRLNEHVAEAEDRVAELLAREKPEEVYVPYHRDGPPDHEVTTRVVIAAARRVLPKVVVLEYPVWYWFHWPIVPISTGIRGLFKKWRGGIRSAWRSARLFRWRVPIADQRATKRRALERHRTQMEQIVADPNWRTLPSVGNGEWLACFFRRQEVFYRHGADET